jgi:hypothetical protein
VEILFSLWGISTIHARKWFSGASPSVDECGSDQRNIGRTQNPPSCIERVHTVEMITSDKVFGSYKLVKCSYYQDTENGDDGVGGEVHMEVESPEFASTCCIGSEWTSLVLDSVRPYNHDTRFLKSICL